MFRGFALPGTTLMPELLTPRLRCSPLQLDDWSFFFPQQDPQVMLYVADPRPQAAIRRRSIRGCRRGRPGMNTGCARWCATG